jgi:uncharacterized protein YbjQ (UPF0145 family)
VTSSWSGQGLPPIAQARMAEIKASGTWSSALTTDEFAAIKSAGFDPVGQVLGAAVYNIGYRGGYGCPSYATFGTYNRMSSGWMGYQPSITAVSSSGSGTAYGPLVRTLYAARRSAIARMTAECAQLGGHGIVGVSLTIGHFAAGGLEFKAIGTAVRAPGAMPLRRPFTSDLSGQDFAKLIFDGVVPVGLALGISVGARHDDWQTRTQASRWTSGNTEVSGYTELINMTRHDARDQLQRDVRALGADGVVIQQMDMRVGEHECPSVENGRDHVAEVTIIGTAITHFTKSTRAAERPSLAILSLDPQRRQAARVRLGKV